MAWPNPTFRFERAAKQNFDARVWKTSRISSNDFLYSGLSFVNEIYSTITPERRVNDAGEDFSFELHFLRGENSPNAYAFHNGENFCVAITIKLFTLLDLFCQTLVCDNELAKILNSDDLPELTSKLESLSHSDLDESKLSVIGITGHDLNDDLIEVYDRYIAHFTKCNSISLQQRDDAILLRNTALEYLIHHEMGHIILGHVGLLRSLPGSLSISEVSLNTINREYITRRSALEFQADTFAAKQLCNTSISHSLMASKSANPKSVAAICTIQLLAIHSVQTILTCLDIIVNKGEVDGDWTSGVSSAIAQTNMYPSGGVRLAQGYIVYIESLQHFCKHEVEGFKWSQYEEISLRFQTAVAHLTRKYNEFALVGTAWKEHVDKCISSLALFDDLSALTKECKSFAFTD